MSLERRPVSALGKVGGGPRTLTRRWPRATALTINLATTLPSVVILVLLWQWWVTRHPVFFLPAPTQIAARLRSNWLSGPAESLLLSAQASQAIQQTFLTALLGWTVACVLGITLGAALGVRRGLVSVAGPPLLIVRSIPPVAVIPITIVILGLGTSMRVTVVIAGCIWPVLLNAVEAVATVDPVLRDVARLHHLNPIATFWRILLPAASPKLFAGLRLSLSLAIVLAVGSELFAGTGGLGGLLLTSQSSFDVAGLWATLVVLGLLGAIVNGFLLLVERVALRWNTLQGT